MVLLFIVLTVVMTVCEGVVVVVVRVPIGAMLKLAGDGFHPTTMMMGDMIMVVTMCIGGVRVRRCTPFSFGSLLHSLRRHLCLLALVIEKKRRMAVSS
jgi:hypothetical protein